MKNWFLNFATGAAVLLAVGSCKKDESQAVLGANAAPQLTASATTATINRNDTSPAVTYSWKAADFNYPAAVTYTLQFAKAGTNFANTADYNVGNALSKSFNQTELNDVYNSLDCTLTSVPTALDVRVKSSVGDAAAAQMSGVKSITATPYLAVTLPTETWGLVGPAADGWPGATATDRMLTYDCKVRAFTITTNLQPGPFLFRMDKAWATKLGGPAGDFTKGVALSTSGADLNWVKAAGTYTIKLEVNHNASGGVVDGKVTITP
ncbi:SusE domain-containing protein [Hymenobacter negativus]|uniref:SusE domain-containing protein n=1 Tax=Hymenobacter negativus TaxID=2795026 RepID=A0ABS0Q523_9BACT|nr:MULTISPECIES: SusE domain-containing protein [Bacteria]MBH8557351.1 SusE domain-containing protein [Hymenobacter negativus]MBH8569641.1 SusE domain-containing protein [Hymenobacter negativus]MBR7209377.1 SusE domain-containing protein [Microvirga sp. STS02]